ncbi:MAG: hypothetical protein EP343_34580 [Deltaproteobacteria bacterium]|nr:MAG: hypothetical protein EP343_34580 [Deltaproteobacteria bacterium]
MRQFFAYCFVSGLALLTVGCSSTLYHTVSKSQTKEDKYYFNMMEKDFQAFVKEPFNVSSSQSENAERIKSKLGTGVHLLKMYQDSLRKRPRSQAFSQWTYGMLLRVARVMEQNGHITHAFMKGFKSAEGEKAAKRKLARARDQFYEEAYFRYTLAMFSAYHQSKLMPQDGVHQKANNPWLKETERRRLQLLKRLGFNAAQNKAFVNKRLSKQINTYVSERVKAKLREHLVTFLATSV